MIITCPDCETNFLVKAEQLGERGRKVRCGSCAYVWHQEPLSPEAIVNEQEIIRNQQENLREAVQQQADGVRPSLPTIVTLPKRIRRLRVAIFVLVIANALAFIILHKQLIGQTGFYNLIGQYNTKDLKITGVSLLEPKEENGKQINYVEWSITNEGKGSMQLPKRKMTVLDKELDVVTSGADAQKLMLKPGETKKFENNSIRDGGKGKYLVLEIGNPYELSLR